MIKHVLLLLCLSSFGLQALANEPAIAKKASAESGSQGVSPISGPGAQYSAEGYCEIFAIEQGFGWTRSENYSTFRVGPCLPEQIDTLTSASASAQMATLGSFDQVVVAGPYSYTMDVNNSQIRNPFISMGNLRFSKVSVSEFTVWDAIKNINEAKRWLSQTTSYNPVRTTGDVDYVWFAGNDVYVLINTREEHFVMTGVLDEVKHSKNGIHLDNMGTFMNLPDGWRFERKKLATVLSMNSRGIRSYEFDRLIDEFGNTYIQIPFDPDLFEKPDAVSSAVKSSAAGVK